MELGLVLDLRALRLTDDDLKSVLPYIVSIIHSHTLIHTHTHRHKHTHTGTAASVSLSVLLDSNVLSSSSLFTLTQLLSDVNVTKLSLYDNDMAMGMGMAHFCRFLATSPHNHLQSLDLDSTSINEKSLTALCRALPQCHQLRELKLSSNDLHVASMQSIADVLISGTSKLQSLHLADNHIGKVQLLC